ncbi:MAG: T9SS type A sorting domain-containing protein [Ignavibacteriae bacterium]|nr:T9SS type A sorting domain-containing protein [Ignavibacteriota bacterium]
MKMYFFYILFFVFIAIFYLHKDSFAQWEQMGGPYRASVYKLCLLGNNLYAGTYDGGIYRSTNYGSYWFPVNNGLLYSNSEVNNITVNGNKLFACLYSKGIFCSLDSGKSWYQSNNGLTNLNVNSVYTYSAKKIFAGTGNGVFYSTNNGNNWYPSGLSGNTVKSFTSIGNNLYAGTTNAGIFWSTNSGLNWTAVNNGLPNMNIYSMAVNGTKIFAGTYGNGIYFSTNYGTNWYLVTYQSPGPFLYVYSIVSNGNYMYSATGNALIRSTDYGANWFKVVELTGYNTIRDVCLKDSTIWVGSDRSIYKSTNNGINWININDGFTNELVLCFTSKDSYLFAGTEGYGLHRSTNGGINWVFCGLTDKSVFSLTTCGSYLFAVTVNESGIYRSTNNGGNWSLASNGLTNNVVMRLVTKENYIFAGTFNGVYRSTNFGDNWIAVNSSMQNYSIYALAVSDSYVYAGVNYAPGGLYMSSNNGDNWISITNNLTNTNIRSILVDCNKLYVGTYGGVFVTTNNGANWDLIGLTTYTTYALIKYGKYLVAGTNSGVYLYNEKSNLWNDRNNGFYDVTWVYTFKINNNYLLAGTIAQSVWRRSLDNIIGINSKTEILPVENKLQQNYPNPFNPATKIKFDIVKTTNVKLEIYDISGRIIKTLVANEKLNAGEYEVEFDGSNLASGVYFYRIETSEFSKTMKMVLLK